MSGFSEHLRMMMAREQVTVCELSRRSGVPEGTLKAYRRGLVRSPRREAIERLAEGLSICPDLLTNPEHWPLVIR